MTPAAIAAPQRLFSPAVVVGVCFAIAALEGYDIQAVGVAAPAMGPALHLARDQIGFAGSAAMVGLVIGAVFGGWLADRIGRRPVLVASVAWFGVFSLVTTLAVDANTLMLVRLATGLGFGGAMPNMIAVAADISGERRRAATVTMMFIGFPVGGALSALVTRLAPAGLDWRFVFLTGGLLPLFVAPLALWLLPETRPTPPAGARPRMLTALVGGGRATSTALLCLAFAFTLASQYVVLSWLPTLVIAKGLSKEIGSLAALSFNLCGIGGGLALGALVDRVGHRWPMAAAYLGLAAVLAALAAMGGAAAMLALSGACGFLIMGALFSIYALAPTYYPVAVRATGTGASVGAGRLGAIVGPSIGGMLLAAGVGPGQVVGAIIPMVLAAALCTVLLTLLPRPQAD